MNSKPELIIITVSAVLGAVASFFLTLWAGFFLGRFLEIMPVILWIILAVMWGGICSGITAYKVVKILRLNAEPVYGVWYGAGAGFLIGLVDGLFTHKPTGGALLGIIVGAVLGYLFSRYFLRTIR